MCVCVWVKVTVDYWELYWWVSVCVCVCERLISSEQWWKGFITMDLYNGEGFYTWSELTIKKKKKKETFNSKNKTFFLIGKETE